ncbi:4-hydroxy-tetrahydrodipicolinate reductase [bacterium]|nr:4-hydroxy-tetrahydrodipicolinate reductase [bacterium]
MKKIKVAVCGANGKMGKEVVAAVLSEPDLELVAKIDIFNGEYNSIEQAKNKCDIDVIIDFTQPEAIFENVKICLQNGIKPVVGTTGLTDAQIAEIKELSRQKGVACLIAPNFSTGAILMMMFAEHAAKYFDNAEIIELHHNQKKDAPSGTAIKTALMMSKAKESFKAGNCPEKETITGSRGGTSYSDIQIHSVRMPGFMASQEVIFGSMGQTFKIRHDSVDRKCYMPGVIMAVRYVAEHDDFVYGLENIL